MKQNTLVLILMFFCSLCSNAQYINSLGSGDYEIDQTYFDTYKNVQYTWTVNGNAPAAGTTYTNSEHGGINFVGNLNPGDILEVEEEPIISYTSSLTWIRVDNAGNITCSSNLVYNCTTNKLGLTIDNTNKVLIPLVSSDQFTANACFTAPTDYFTPQSIAFNNNVSLNTALTNTFILQYLTNKLHDFEAGMTANCTNVANFSLQHKGGVLYLPENKTICISKLYVWDGVAIVGGCSNTSTDPTSATARTIIQRVDDFPIDVSNQSILITCAHDINITTTHDYIYPIVFKNITLDGNNVGRYVGGNFVGGVLYEDPLNLGNYIHAYDNNFIGNKININQVPFEHNHNFLIGPVLVCSTALPSVRLPSYFHTGAGGGITYTNHYNYSTLLNETNKYHNSIRLKAFIYDCEFDNAIADGYSELTNTDVKVMDCKGNNCARGSFVLTGSNTKTKLYNCLGTKGIAAAPSDPDQPVMYTSPFQAEIDKGFQNAIVTTPYYYKDLYIKDSKFDGGSDYTNEHGWDYSRVYVQKTIFNTLEYPEFDICGPEINMMVNNIGLNDIGIFYTGDWATKYMRAVHCAKFDSVVFCQKIYTGASPLWIYNDTRGLYVSPVAAQVGHHCKIGFNNCYFGRNTNNNYATTYSEFRSGIFMFSSETSCTTSQSQYLYFKNSLHNTGFTPNCVTTPPYVAGLARKAAYSADPFDYKSLSSTIMSPNVIMIPSGTAFHMNTPVNGYGDTCIITKADLLTYQGYRVVDANGNKPAPAPETANTIPSELVVYPNPNSGKFTLEYPSVIEDEIAISIKDVHGKIISKLHKACFKGTNVYTMNFENLTSGLYLIQTQSAKTGKINTLKFTKR